MPVIIFELVSADRTAGDEIKTLPTAATIAQNEPQKGRQGIQSP